MELRELTSRHEEKLRFLVAGTFNTALGYGIFALLLHLLGTARYNLALTLQWTVSVTISYAVFKAFVFRTRGTNWVGEWARSYLVYAFSLVVNLALLNLFVKLLHVHPLFAQLACIAVVTVLSYLGHKYFTFRGGRHLVEAIDGGDVFERAEGADHADE